MTAMQSTNSRSLHQTIALIEVGMCHRATIRLEAALVAIPADGCIALRDFDGIGGEDSCLDVPNRLSRDGGEKPAFREPSGTALLPSKK